MTKPGGTDTPQCPTWGQRLRRLLYRSTVAALAATVVDFAVFKALMLWEGVSPPLATGAGCVVGALVNYSMNRVWTFQSKASPSSQLLRYALVSASGAGLNSGGMTLLLHYLNWGPSLSWIIIRLLVSWGWNLPLQRFFVFPKSSQQAAELPQQ